MTAAAGARNLFKVDAGVVHALMQARYQNSSRGQFISEDPVFLGDPRQQQLTDPQTLNSYSYANGNPINKSDPTGLKSSFTDMGFFNNSYPGLPTSVAQQFQQAKYDTLKVAVGLPIATEMAGGILASAVMAPELSAARVAAAYQGALVDVALRATNDVRSGQSSSGIQYGGSALFGGFTGVLTSSVGVLGTMGITAPSSGAENKFLDGSTQPKQVAANSFGAGVGQFAGSAVSNAPALKPFAPILAPAINSLTTYAATALSTALFVPNNRKN